MIYPLVGRINANNAGNLKSIIKWMERMAFIMYEHKTKQLLKQITYSQSLKNISVIEINHFKVKSMT